MVEVGDVIEITTRKVGQAARKGTVKTVQGALITVVWDSGDETRLIPAAGSLTVIETLSSGGVGTPSPPAPEGPGSKESKKKPAVGAGKAKPGPKSGKRG